MIPTIDSITDRRGKVSKFDLLRQLNIFKFLKLNYFSSNIYRKKGKYIFPFRNAVIDIDPSAKITIEDHLFINSKEMKRDKTPCYFYLKADAELHVKGVVQLHTGSTLKIQEHGKIQVGKTYFNHGAVIIAANEIKMGDGILTSRGVTIFDSDFHKIMDKDGNQLNTPRSIEIGDHVWIGVNGTILRGSKIGTGAVIAANSVVGGKIKEGTMASGNPARSYSEIYWEE